MLSFDRGFLSIYTNKRSQLQQQISYDDQHVVGLSLQLSYKLKPTRHYVTTDRRRVSMCNRNSLSVRQSFCLSVVSTLSFGPTDL